MVAVMDRSVDERADERRRGARRGLQLWLKERRDEERMTRKLDDAGVTVIILADDVKAGALDGATVLRVEPIAAMIAFDDTPPPIDRGRATGGIQKHGSRFTNERARQGRNHRRRRVGIRFGVVCVGKAGDVARVLEQRVLKSSAHAEKRKTRHPRMTGSGEGALETRIWTSRREPDRVDESKSRIGIRGEPGCRNPAPLQRMLAQLANVTERFIDREMGVHRRIEISDNGEACGNGHVVLRPPAARSVQIQLWVSGSGYNLKTLNRGQGKSDQAFAAKTAYEPASVGDVAQFLAMSRCFRAVAARGHVAPAPAAVLCAVVEDARAACVGAAPHTGQLAEYQRVSR